RRVRARPHPSLRATFSRTREKGQHRNSSPPPCWGGKARNRSPSRRRERVGVRVAQAGCGRGYLRLDADAHTSSLDHLSRADLAGLAQLDRAIHLHPTTGDELLAGTPAVDHAAQLQQLVEFDVVALELEFDLLHQALLFPSAVRAQAEWNGFLENGEWMIRSAASMRPDAGERQLTPDGNAATIARWPSCQPRPGSV